ncbi:MAG: RNA methyltransferase [Pseudomonadota bacterium]
MQSIDYIRVVLVEPTHPGNIGATARAMANFGFHSLHLVRPHRFPDEIAVARAAGADHILHSAVVHDSLDEALRGCRTVVGSTARDREIQWPVQSPETCMSALGDGSVGPVALVFGRESSGLTNDELERCQILVRIPVNPEFSSLNLGSAVTVLLYELRKQMSDVDVESSSSEPLAVAEDVRRLLEHFDCVLRQIEFSDGRSGKLNRKLTRLFARTRLYAQEVNMLRGILKAVENRCRRE